MVINNSGKREAEWKRLDLDGGEMELDCLLL